SESEAGGGAENIFFAGFNSAFDRASTPRDRSATGAGDFVTHVLPHAPRPTVNLPGASSDMASAEDRSFEPKIVVNPAGSDRLHVATDSNAPSEAAPGTELPHVETPLPGILD